MTVAAPAVLKCVTDMTYSGLSRMQNVWYWLLPAGSDAQAESDILTNVATKLNTMYAYLNSYVNSSFSYDTVKIDVVEWNAVDEYWETVQTVGTTALNVTPASVADPVSPFVTAFITAFTSRVKTRARKMFGGISEGAALIGVPTGALQTALGQVGAAWLVDIVMPNNNELQPVVASAIGEVYALLETIVGDVLGSCNSRKYTVGM